jgi:hypothetical protein
MPCLFGDQFLKILTIQADSGFHTDCLELPDKINHLKYFQNEKDFQYGYLASLVQFLMKNALLFLFCSHYEKYFQIGSILIFLRYAFIFSSNQIKYALVKRFMAPINQKSFSGTLLATL